MKKLIMYLILPACIFSTDSCMVSKNDSIRVAHENNKKKVTKDLKRDAAFAVCAADMNMFEAKVGELAAQNATSAAVKELGKKLVADHDKMYNEIKAITSAKNISVPEKLSDRGQKAYDRFSVRKGEKFEKSYLKCSKKHHKKALCYYKKEVKKGKDPELNSVAQKNIPLLRDHLQMIKTACKERKK